MPITERGRWSSSRFDERGRLVINNITEQGHLVIGEPPAPPTKKYLSMDGIDDWVATPGGIFMSRMVVEFSATNPQIDLEGYIIDARDGSPIRIVTATLQYSEILVFGQDAANVTLNGVPITSEYPIEPDTKYVLDITATGVTEYGNSGITFFSNTYRDSSFFKGNLYDVKIYEGSTLVLHYDLTTGTLQDQSGNGRHGLKSGGTWVEEAPSGIDVSQSFATWQMLYVSRQGQFMTKQALYANRMGDYVARQSVSKQLSEANNSFQRIHKEINDYLRLSVSLLSNHAHLYANKTHIYFSNESIGANIQRLYRNNVSDIIINNSIHSNTATPHALVSQFNKLKDEIFTLLQVIYDKDVVQTHSFAFDTKIIKSLDVSGTLQNKIVGFNSLNNTFNVNTLADRYGNYIVLLSKQKNNNYTAPIVNSIHQDIYGTTSIINKINANKLYSAPFLLSLKNYEVLLVSTINLEGVYDIYIALRGEL